MTTSAWQMASGTAALALLVLGCGTDADATGAMGTPGEPGAPGQTGTEGPAPVGGTGPVTMGGGGGAGPGGAMPTPPAALPAPALDRRADLALPMLSAENLTVISVQKLFEYGIPVGLAVDPAGNVNVISSDSDRMSPGPHFNKFSPSLDRIGRQPLAPPSVPQAGFGVVDAAAASGGELFATGTFFPLDEAGKVSKAEVAVLKYGADGQPIWFGTFGSRETDSVSRILLGSDGSVVVAGTTSGNLRGLTATTSGPFLARYNAAGTLLWQRQPVGAPVGADGAGNLIVPARGELRRMAPDSRDLPSLPLPDAAPRLEVVAWHPLGFYGFGVPRYIAPPLGTPATPVTGISLFFLDSSLTRLWWRPALGPAQVAVPKPAINIKSVDALMATSDAIYSGGIYEATVGDRTVYPCFVARHDLEGNLVWSRQFKGETVANHFTSEHCTIRKIAIAGDTVFAAGHVSQTYEARWFIMALSAHP